MIQPQIKILGDHYELPNMHFMSVCYGISLKGSPDDFVTIYKDTNGGTYGNRN